MAQLKNGKELIEWLEEADILFRLNEKEAFVILSYLNGSGKSLEATEGALALCDEVSGTKTPITIDDVVDFACEANYERMEETIQRIAAADRGEDTQDDEQYLTELSIDEDILDEVFKQTCYQTQISKSVKLLAGEQQSLKAGYSR